MKQEITPKQQFLEKQPNINYFGIVTNFYLSVFIKQSKLCIFAINPDNQQQFAQQFTFSTLPSGVQYFLQSIQDFGSLLIKAILMDNVQISSKCEIKIEYITKSAHQNSSIKRSLKLQVKQQRFNEQEIMRKCLRNLSEQLAQVTQNNIEKQIKIKQLEHYQAKAQYYQNYVSDLQKDLFNNKLLYQNSQTYLQLKKHGIRYNFNYVKPPSNLCQFRHHMNKIQLITGLLDSNFHLLVADTAIHPNQIIFFQFKYSISSSELQGIAVGLTNQKQKALMLPMDDDQSLCLHSKSKHFKNKLKQSIEIAVDTIAQKIWWFVGSQLIGERSIPKQMIDKPLYPFLALQRTWEIQLNAVI